MAAFMNNPPASANTKRGRSNGVVRPSNVARSTAATRGRFQPFRMGASRGGSSFVPGPTNAGAGK